MSSGILKLVDPRQSVDLSGDWRFWPERFIDPAVQPLPDSGRFERFSAPWTSYERGLPAQSFASYAVTITGLDPAVQYAFLFPGFSSATRYYVNGRELYSQGRPGISFEEEVPCWDAAVVSIADSGLTECTLVMHLSNFNDILPATGTAIVFGPYATLADRQDSSRLMMIIPFGAILAMGMYFISLFMFHRDEWASLYLGLLCMVFALRILCYDEFILRDILPAVSSIWQFKLGYLTFSLAPPLFMAFVRALYPDLTWRPAVYGITVISVGYALLNLFTAPLFFTSVLHYFQMFVGAAGIYLIGIILVAAFQKREGASLFLSGFIVFFLVVVRDILLANRYMEGLFLGHFGVLGIIFAMSLLLVRRFTGAFGALEKAATALEKTNQSLSRFVPNDFLKYLDKHSITEISLGDNVKRRMCVMFVHLGVDLPMMQIEKRINLLELLNETLLQINPLIQKYHGFIDKYLVEGVMVLFPEEGEPVIRCALEMQAALDHCNRKRKILDLPLIKFAAGIHRGELMLGTIGETERMDGTVISDVVNMACRLESFASAKDVPIIVTEVFLTDIPADAPFELISHGQVHLRGKERPIELYEVRRK